MKTYVVTGGCGFIGSHMVDKLIGMGHTVYVIDNLSARSNEYFYRNDSKKAIYYNLTDVSDTTALMAVFDSVFENSPGKIHAVFHFAAEARIQPMINDPSMAVRANVIGTLNVLEACKRYGVGVMVHSSTSSVYGNGQTMPLNEDANRNPLNPYSISKACAEDFCKMYHDLWGINVIVLRYFNVFGERQPIKGTYAPVVGKFMKQHENGECLTVVGDGSQKRDFTWVGDIIEANLAVANSPLDLAGKIINVGTGQNISILELARGISENICFCEERPGEAKESLADNSMIKSIGWKPTKRIDEWVKENIGQKKFSTAEKIY